MLGNIHNSINSITDWYADVFCGNAVVGILGQETGNIIINKLSKYYEYTTLSDEEFFSQTFETSASDIRDKFIKISYRHNKSFGMDFALTIVFLILSIASYILVLLAHNAKDDVDTLTQYMEDYNKYIDNAKKRIDVLEERKFKNIKCPNCGANVSINVLGKGKCSYCGIDINMTKKDIEKIVCE